MHDLLGRPPLSEVADEIQRIADSVLAIDRPVLAPRIDLVELTACCHLEAALLDRGRPYHRIVRKNTASSLDGTDSSSLVLFDEGMELDAQGIVLAPLHLTFDIGRDRPRKHAVVDIVTAAAAVSEVIAPEGRRRRAIRPWALLGSWLRSSLDRTYDVIHSSIRDHLLEEGSIRVVPLPELENADLDGLEGLSERLLNRLRARWAGMDHAQRATALSEIVLPTLDRTKLSTPRIEMLVWMRVLGASWTEDLATRASRALESLASDSDQVGWSHTWMDGVLTQG